MSNNAPGPDWLHELLRLTLAAAQAEHCTVTDDEVIAYFTGNLVPPERDELKRHIDGCSACAQRLEALALGETTAEELAGKPLDALPQRVETRLSALWERHVSSLDVAAAEAAVKVIADGWGFSTKLEGLAVGAYRVVLAATGTAAGRVSRAFRLTVEATRAFLTVEDDLPGLFIPAPAAAMGDANDAHNEPPSNVVTVGWDEGDGQGEIEAGVAQSGGWVALSVPLEAFPEGQPNVTIERLM